MNARLDSVYPSPAWCILRVWAAELRDRRGLIGDDGAALVEILDVYDQMRARSTLAPALWKSALLLAADVAARHGLTLPTGGK